MITLPFVDTHEEFPPLSMAMDEPNGLLCWGGALTSERLQRAYRAGIYPWFSPGQSPLWWSPDPRMVLPTSAFKLQRSLVKAVRNGGFEIRVDSAFEQVIRACGTKPRPGQDGTWITDEVVSAYTALHHDGFAHSIEAWKEGALVGGLYGVSLGRMFYGESMFAHVRDASKVALTHLVLQLRRWNFPWIDCQQETAHLASLGASPMDRNTFAPQVLRLVDYPHRQGKWMFDADLLLDFTAR
jgi:leucyl/phenylalanyl-tRNA---protein transferase